MNRPGIAVLSLASALWCAAGATGEEAKIRVRADVPGPELSRHMTGLCIEDVNHEMYGGIDSQMIFGESFQEAPRTSVDGFASYGGTWTVEGFLTLRGAAGDGPKLIAERPPLTAGKASVQLRFADASPGLAGLIVKVSKPEVGADRFQGYEISLDPGRRLLVLGRHRGNWEPIREVPCDVPVDRWIELSARFTDVSLEVRVDGKTVLTFEDREHPLRSGSVGLRTWQKEARFRSLSIQGEMLPFLADDPHGAGGVSGMWRMVRGGVAAGRFAIETERPFLGVQSQRITFEGGEGAIGVENRGLNRWGLAFVAGKPYEGRFWMRAERPARVRVAAESGDGSKTFGEAFVDVDGADWKPYDVTLTTTEGGGGGRLAITLDKPGSVVLGYALLQAGPWGRFKGLPVRKDVADAILDAGVTVMRMGGLMANADAYRWKNTIGPRDRRPPYKGFWYPKSSNGWGIFEFLGFCEAAGILPVVDLNTGEAPQDLADFVEYANGPAESPWGRRRAQDGHPAPYGLKYIELGNEESVDEAYWTKFKPLAEAIWAKDPNVILVVGDFEYKRPITDPYKFEGAPRIKTLAAHKKILDLAKAHGREVGFDVHIWNHNPRDAHAHIAALATFEAALKAISPGASFQICILEENATNHSVRRAVAHGETINGLMRLGHRVRIVCAANALQPDGQNDNGWDQGLVFLNPAKAWLQPPAYVTQMVSKNAQARVVDASVTGADGDLDVTATRDADGKLLILQVTNVADAPRTSQVEIEGFTPSKASATVEELTGPLDASNTAEAPTRIRPRRGEWKRASGDKTSRYTFPPYSFTVLRFE